jgi:hypothetical protein
MRLIDWATTTPTRTSTQVDKARQNKVSEALTGSVATLAMKIHTRPSNWRLYQLHTVLAT